MKKTRYSLWMSVLSLMLCVSMLVGTSYAWFTDNVTSGNNRIMSGTLDVEMYWAEDYNGPWYDVEDPQYNTIFNYDKWEPGYTELRYIKVVNAGNLALKYRLSIGAAGEVGAIADVIDAYFVADPGEINNRTDFSQIESAGTLGDLIRGLESGVVVAPEWPLLPEGADPEDGPVGEEVFAVALHMQETAGNEYQGTSIGEGFYLTLRAAQLAYEEDSFGSDYDEDAAFPVLRLPALASASVATDETGVVTDEVTISTVSAVSAVIPSGTELEAGADYVTLSVSLVSEEGNIYGGDHVVSRTLDVHVSNVAETNTQPIIITIPNALPANMEPGAVALYHTEGGVQNQMTRRTSASEVANHNDYFYNSSDGSVVMALASFSEILFEASVSDTWISLGIGRDTALAEYNYASADTSWYTGHENDSVYTLNTAAQLEGLAKLVNKGENNFEGKTIKLAKDIIINDWDLTEKDLSNKTKYIHSENKDYCALDFAVSANNDPAFENNGTNFKYFPTIGSYESENYRPFKGTFDGNNHTISGLFHLYYDDPMEKSNIGLFGMVDNATIKNLTISDCFYYTYGGMIGMVATRAYHNCTFENIRVRENFATQYNYYLGGIVGYVYSGGNTTVTLKNCYVDNTNIFEALWGTYDAAIGGLVGAVGAKDYDAAPQINIQNCTVFPTVSLYNDCCANYQWFAYRYSGMLVGYVNASNRAQYIGNKIICTDVVVKYGDWTDQYYCECVELGKGSYNGEHEWKYQRISKDDLLRDEDDNLVLVDGKITCDPEKTGHDHREYKEYTYKGQTYTTTAEDEDHIATNIAFNQLFGGGQGVYGETVDKYAEYRNKPVAECGVEIIDNGEGGANIATNFVNRDKYLYRVGNRNTLKLGTLFNISGSYIQGSRVRVFAEKITGVTSVDYDASNSNWADRTLKFNGTGVVRLKVEYLDSKPCILNLEVVDAVNYGTGAGNYNNAAPSLSASNNNVVLVSNASGGFDVKNGYIFYGNGFDVTINNDVARSDLASGFVTVEEGKLDNVNISAPVFPEAYMYTAQFPSTPASTSPNGTKYYNSTSSAVVCKGNATITNSCISGGRAALHIVTGKASISNSRFIGGSVANILLSSSVSEVALADIETVQVPTYATMYNTSKQVVGLGVLALVDDTGSSSRIVLEGSLKQYNWANSTYTSYVPSGTSSIISQALKKADYTHAFTGDSNKWINMGIAYMNSEANDIPTQESKVTDNRTNKNAVPYSFTGIQVTNKTVAWVYTYNNSVGTDGELFSAPNYQATESDNIKPIINVSGTSETLTSDCYYDSVGGEWVYGVVANDIAEFRFNQVSVKKYGKSISFTVKDENNNPINADAVLELSDTSTRYYYISFTDNIFYDKEGNSIAGSAEYVYKFRVLSKVEKINPPEIIRSDLDTGLCVASSYGGTWSGAAPALEGIVIRYYSSSQKKYIDLALNTLTPTTIGKQNGTNNTWTYKETDFELTLTGGQIHSGNKVNGMPVVCDNSGKKLYFLPSSTKGLVNSGSNSARSVPVNYKFVANGDQLEFNYTWSVAEDKNKEYKYSDFCDGKLTQLQASGGACVVAGTLITLADGTQKPIEELVADDMILTFDHETGKYVASPIFMVVTHGVNTYDVMKLGFSDGTELGIIESHGLFDLDLRQYVDITEDNYQSLIGCRFAKYDAADGSTKALTLTSAEIVREETEMIAVFSYGNLNAITEGLISYDTKLFGTYNYFTYDENMKYVEEDMGSDIAEYGLYTYDDWKDYISEDTYNAFNFRYYKISIAKGLCTEDVLKYYVAWLRELEAEGGIPVARYQLFPD